MGGAFDMARQDMIDAPPRLQRGVQRIDRGAGNTEGDGDALLLQNAHGSIDSSHLRHVTASLHHVRWQGSSRRRGAISTRSILFPTMWQAARFRMANQAISPRKM